MFLGGLQKTTLIDFPGQVACTVFTVGCNFRCPFCHNKDLITKRLFKDSGLNRLPEKEFFQFLEDRKTILDGVCITGGEPTIHQDLPQFCRQIKTLGLKVKLDSNGSNPSMLKELIEDRLIVFISMDIKNPFDRYHQSMGVKGFEDQVKKSVKLIVNSGLDYEFRTTVVPTIHDQPGIVALAEDLARVISQADQEKVKKTNYLLQQFRPKNCLDKEFLKIKPFTDKEMEAMLAAVQPIFPKAEIRGKD